MLYGDTIYIYTTAPIIQLSEFCDLGHNSYTLEFERIITPSYTLLHFESYDSKNFQVTRLPSDH